MKSQNTKLSSTERRSIVDHIEVRSLGSARTVYGYALKFNFLSKDLGGFQECIDPAALNGVDLSDVVALFNHDKNLILARTTSKTLRLTIDKVGLRYEFDPPNTAAGNDLLISIKRGDVSGSSFQFIVSENGDSWDLRNGVMVRTILKFSRIIDVSPVVFPAYNETDIAKRSLDSFKTKYPHRYETMIMIDNYRKN